MKLEQQVTSLELSKKLKELGVKQNGIYWWVTDKFHYKRLHNKDDAVRSLREEGVDIRSAFTVAELGEMLPAHLQIDKYQSSKYLWSVKWTDMETKSHSEQSDTEANARAKMLIYLLENDLI